MSRPPTQPAGQPGTGEPIEIERKYLLTALPTLPESADAVHIEQGYLPESAGGGGAVPAVEGRIRRQIMADGTLRLSHTIKRGSGIQRTEIERELTEQEYEHLWPQTAGRRLRKVRYRIRENAPGGPVIWEVDAFEEMELVLAEVELDSASARIEFPAWLVGFVQREVTDEEAYTNFALATRGVP